MYAYRDVDPNRLVSKAKDRRYVDQTLRDLHSFEQHARECNLDSLGKDLAEVNAVFTKVHKTWAGLE